MSHRKTVVVTGASSGVGRAVARRFAEDGSNVALVARNADALAAAAREVEERGGTALVLPTDVADETAVRAAARATEETLGPIDVWVNNAMTTVFAFFQDVDPEEYRRATDVTYLGTVWGTRAALEQMVPRNRGSVVQVGSAMAYRGIPLQAPYCGAKHAIKGFSESVRTELKHQGSKVRISMVQLPGLNTPQFDHCRSKFDRHPMPVPPVYQPEVAARAVHWAAGHRRPEIYVGLPAIYTVLGNKVATRFMDWYLARNGVSGQLMDEPPSDQNHPGNLFDTPAGDPQAHGRFDDMAHGRSPALWLATHRGVGVAALGALAAAVRPFVRR